MTHPAGVQAVRGSWHRSMLRTVVGATLLACGLLAGGACSTVEEEPEPEPDPSGCEVPDTSCPADMPYPGSPCAGSLSCTYEDIPDIPWAFSCTDSRWEGEPDCSMIVGGCPVPPPAEGCSGAFDGQLDGVTVQVAPGVLGAFEPFIDGEQPDVVVGAQGAAMVFYRLRLDGEDVPSCVLVTATVTPDGIQPLSSTLPTTLRCGDSLTMYVIMPEGDCSGTELIDTRLSIDIAGIGSTEVMLRLPPDAFCGGFG